MAKKGVGVAQGSTWSAESAEPLQAYAPELNTLYYESNTVTISDPNASNIQTCKFE
jgi:hypothetical protein